MESRLDGVPEMIQGLKNIDQNIARKWIRTALRNAAKIYQRQLQADAPNTETRNALKVRAGKRSRLGISVVVSISKKFFKGVFWQGFFDRGHKTGTRKSKDRREIPGTFWAEKSFEKASPAAQDAIAATLKEGLETEAANCGAKK